jgi:hypothetical protein
MCNYDNAKQAVPMQTKTPSGAALSNAGGYSPRPSVREELEKRQFQSSDEAMKREAAIQFFRDNPAFDQFIQLIRSGSIHI